MATPRLVMLIFGHPAPEPFPSSPSGPSQEQKVQSHGLEASAHSAVVFSGRPAGAGGCLQLEKHGGAAPPPAAALTRTAGSGKGCLAVSAFPSVRRNAPYQQKASSVRAAARLYLWPCKERGELGCQQAFLPSQPDSPQQPGCSVPP